MKFLWKKWCRRLAACIAILLILGAFLLLGAIVCWYWYVPELLSKQVLPELAKTYGLEPPELKIRQLGLSGADLEGITLKDRQGGMLKVDAVRVDYTPTWPAGDGPWLMVEKVTITGGELSLTLNDGKLSIAGIDLERLLQTLERRKQAAAPTNGASTPVVSLKELALRDTKVLLHWNGKRLTLPMELVVRPQDDTWQQFSGTLTVTPRGQTIRCNFKWDRRTMSLNADGSLGLRVDSFADLVQVPINGRLAADFQSSLMFTGGDLSADTRLSGSFDLGPQEQYGLNFTAPVSFETAVKVERNARQLQLNFEGGCRVPEVAANAGLLRLKPAQPLTFTGKLQLDGKHWNWQELDVSTGPLQAEGYGLQLQSAGFRLDHSGNRFLLNGRELRLSAPTDHLELSEIILEVPLPPTPQDRGIFCVGKIQRKGVQLGSVETDFHLDEGRFLLQGKATTPFVPNARFDFRGEVEPRSGEAPDIRFEANIPTYRPPEPMQLDRYLPALGEGATLDGTVTLGATFRIIDGKTAATAAIFTHDGRLLLPKSGVAAEEIELDLRIEDLLNVNSSAGQRLKIGRLSAGRLLFSDLELKFELESPHAVQIESLTANWCGGELFMRALRLRTNQKNWSTVIYCEGLELSEVINQLNLASASGEGAIYGKIPVKVNANGIFFDRSYLYSRPGKENTIRVADPDRLFGNAGDAAMQAAQLEFAAEAMRDFHYNWVKVNLNTDQDNLLLSFQFDGQPSGPLPFRLDENTGTLIRDAGSKAHFQGIQLNINTRIPFNRVLLVQQKLYQSKDLKP